MNNLFIETENLILRLPKEEDSAALFEILGDADTIKYMSMDPFPDEEFVKGCIGRWAARKNETPDYIFSIVEKDSGNAAGMINTCGMHNDDPVVGYCLNKRYWGKGYMTEALKAFDEFLFEKGYDTIVIDAVDDNIASNAVIKKGGFGYIGSSMESLSELKPEPVKILMYRLLKENDVTRGVRRAEDALSDLLCIKEQFSDNLLRYRDAALPDMYDLNQFMYSSMPKEEEIEAAIEYQKEHGDNFIKIEGRFALNNRFKEKYLLEESDEITLLLKVGNIEDWTKNTNVCIKDLVHDPEIAEDLLFLEVRNYAGEWGEDFTRRKMEHWLAKAKEDNGLNFYAAYLDGKIAGSLYSFRCGDYLIIDGLIVDPWARQKYVATTLLKECIRSEGGVPFLHADPDDTPKEMYVKLGFRLVDYKYGYIRTW